MSKAVDEHIKAVVFDFDDTLVGTHIPVWKLHRHIAKTHYGVELDDDMIREHWGQPLATLARHYYGTDDVDVAVERIVSETSNFPKEVFPQANLALKRLKENGKLIGIVSASHLSIVRQDMRAAGLDEGSVDYLQTAEDTPVHKPDPAVFDPMFAWAKERGVLPGEILYVGDGLQDMTAAAKAGLHFLGVTTGLVAGEEFAMHGAESIGDLSEL